MFKRWDDLPEFMRVPEVKPYYEIVMGKRHSLILKRAFDLCLALILTLLLALPMAVIAILIKADSKGPVFYRQERVTTYGKHFWIHKFRTMVEKADEIGSAVTVRNDVRVTKVGSKLRNLRLDELPQVFDVLSGNMSFVGTRPEVVKYVDMYEPEYYATLLLPAGITSEASIRYKDEYKLLSEADDIDRVYMEKVLPEKMKWNLETIRNFGFRSELKIFFEATNSNIFIITKQIFHRSGHSWSEAAFFAPSGSTPSRNLLDRYSGGTDLRNNRPAGVRL